MTAPGAPLRVLVVDDEPLARRTLTMLLAEAPGVETVGEAAHGGEAVERIRALRPDLVFLDVQMPERDGFEVLRALAPEETPAVVFVTAYDEHAVRAFDVHAADYLLKPFDDERFHTALARARQRVGEREARDLARRLSALLAAAPAPEAAAAPAPAPETGWAERIVLKDTGRIRFLETERIDWIEAADYVVRLHAGGQSYLLREPLGDLERRLDPRRFVRIHRSTIVNVERVKEMQPLFHGEYAVLLRDGTRLRLSRSRRDALRTLLG